MSEDPPTKACPDCAETVLAAARKCRFCGYRFDAAPRQSSGPAVGGLLKLLRSAEPSPMSVQELLDEWNIPQDDEDPQPALLFGSIGRVTGYIVVTHTRFCFVPATRVSGAAAVRAEHFLSDLLRVHARRHRMRRALFIEWRDTRTIVNLGADQSAALYELLSPRALLRSRGHDAGTP